MGADIKNDYRQSLDLQKGRKKKKKILAAILIVLAAAVTAAGAWFGLAGQRAEKRYEEYIAEGNRYLVQMDYDAAEAAFQRAIEVLPEETEGYEKLAGVYIAQSRYEEAEELLVRGIRLTNADVLVKTYQRVSELLLNLAGEGMDAGDFTRE